MKPGDRLPSEPDLAERLKVSRYTIRTALTTLADEGLILPQPGRGWRVREQHTMVWVASQPERNEVVDVSPADGWSMQIRSQGGTPREEIAAELLLADEQHAAMFDVPVGEPLIVRRRRRYADERLHATADTLFRRSDVTGSPIELPADILPGTYAVLEERGIGWRTYRDTMRWRPASVAERNLYKCGPGVAVVRHLRIRKTAEDRVVAVTITTLPGDRNEIIYEGVWQ